MTLCMGDLFICGLYHGFMKSDLRISIKDYRRNKNLKIQLTQVHCASSRSHPPRRCGRSAGVLTRSAIARHDDTKFSDRALDWPPAAAGTAALRPRSNYLFKSSAEVQSSSSRLRIIRARVTAASCVSVK